MGRLVIQDPKGGVLLELRLDSPDSSQFKQFVLRNTSGAPVDDVKLRALEAGWGVADASHLANRSVISMAFTRLSSGMAENHFLGLGPIAVMNDIDDELESVNMDGFLQLSADSFVWGSLVMVGPLLVDEYLAVYARYNKPLVTATEQIFRFTIRNIGGDTFQNVILTAAASDKLSLDGSAYAASVNLGTMAPAMIKTVWLKTIVIAPRPAPATIDALSASTVEASMPFEVGSARAYCSIQTVRSYLRTIDVTVISTDEEILDLIYGAAEQIDCSTRRRFDMTLTTERYEDPGVGKLVLRNWPIVEVNAIRLYDHLNKMVKELKPTDTDWSEQVIVDEENGFLEFPIMRQPIFLTTDTLPWRTGAPSAGAEWPQSADVRRMASILAWIEVDYVYGFEAIPELTQKTCMKLVVMELLGKKGASESQGTSTFTIAGLGETWGQGAGIFGGPFGALLGQLNADIEKDIVLLRRRRGITVSIM